MRKFEEIFIGKAAGLLLAAFVFCAMPVKAQVQWANVDSSFGIASPAFHVYKTTDSLDGKPFIAYYASVLLKDKHFEFTTDTTYKRRLTPTQFYERNGQPLLVVNASFFSFETNANLNVIINNGHLLAYNVNSLPMRGKDTFQYRHPFGSAIGIGKNREADVAWLYTDSSKKFPYAVQQPIAALKDSVATLTYSRFKTTGSTLQKPGRRTRYYKLFSKWKMETAVGGGPVLVQDGRIMISNEEEFKFTGKAINDKHPRTAMGYTADGQLIILVIEGRYPGRAEGATLQQTAQLLINLGCMEALNLDGGGSSCMLLSGKETIKPSSNGVQRPVPAVFIVRQN
jgi:hypothetical protein